MKKLVKALATVLALALCLSLASAALAAEYVVAPGDSLWRIAQRTLGRGARWRELYEANAAIIRDPSLIYVGQRLIIPDAQEAPAPDTAAETTPANVPGKLQINFEGRITSLDGDRITLDNGTAILLTESTAFHIPQGTVSHIILTPGTYIQGYTADDPQGAELTAASVLVTPL